MQGKIGIWFAPEGLTAAQSAAMAQLIETLGYNSLWIGETFGRDPFSHLAFLGTCTERLILAPGIANTAEALFVRTAALPRIELVAPKQTIGSNTIAAMQSGVIFGYAGLIDGITGRIQKQLGEKAHVVATGGYASLIVEQTPVIDEVNPDITLIGLRLIYLMNREQD